MRSKIHTLNFIVITLFIQIAVNITVFFDIPVARQILGVIYFTIFPGYIILKLLRFHRLNAVTAFLLSVGLSLAFLMLGGLLVNEFSQMIGIPNPLSTLNLLVFINIFTMVGLFIVYLTKEASSKDSVTTLKIQPVSILLLTIPILSIVGALEVKFSGNNSILLLMLIAIALLFIISIVYKRLLPKHLYFYAILIIAVSLVFHSTLISNYVLPHGSDVPSEFLAFRITQNSNFWSSQNPLRSDAFGRLYAMLSITILPTVYATGLNLDPELVFIIVFPAIFSLVAVGLYQLWQMHIGRKYAFIAAFLFMSQSTFYTEMMGLQRQIIAELFFVLLLIVLFMKDIKFAQKFTCFAVFSIALIVSHYGVAEVFMLMISLVLLLTFLLRRRTKTITLTTVLFFMVIMFSWYIFTASSSVFNSFSSFGNNVISQLGDFFNPASRSSTILIGLGVATSPTIWNTLSRITAYLTEILIVIGFVGVATKRFKAKYSFDYFVFTSIAALFLGALIIIPGLADTLNMTRFYHILLFFLAPLCVLGAKLIANLIVDRKIAFRKETRKQRHTITHILLIAILIPYFLFQTNFIYEVTGSMSWSLPLSKYRVEPSRLHYEFNEVTSYDAYGACWFSNNVFLRGSILYADDASRLNVLTSIGLIYQDFVFPLRNVTLPQTGDMVYLNSFNTQQQTIASWNISRLAFNLRDLNRIYTNGYCDVLKNNQ